MKLTGNRCKCSGCGRYFNSVAAFEKHRSGPADARLCRDPAEIGMARNAASWWITGAMEVKPTFLATTKREKSTISETRPSDTPEQKRA